MGAKALKTEGTTTAKRKPSRVSSGYAEDPHAQYLLTGTSPQGNTAYFFKMQITGLCDRIFGPYESRSLAIRCFEMVLEAPVQSFCEVQNVGRTKANGAEHIALPRDLTPVPMR